jgi:hypothetical protein
MKAADRARFRRRLVRANAALTRTLEKAMRRELQISAHEAVAGAFDLTIHRARVEDILAAWYRATCAHFGQIGADMLGVGHRMAVRAEPTPEEAAAAAERRAKVEAVLMGIVATAVAAAFVAVVVRALMDRPAVVAAVDAAVQAANGDVAGATATVMRDPAVMAAVAEAIVSAIPAAPPIEPPRPPPPPPPIDPPVEPPKPPPPPPSGGQPPRRPGREEFLARVERYVREFAPERARKIAATSQQAVTDALASAAREGLSEENAAKRVFEALAGEVSMRRARTIARTEIGAAQNAALIFEADGSERRVRKTWAAIDDARTRPAHAAADGQTIAPGEKFLVDGEFLAHPGDPNGSPGNIINCRCTMLLEPIE